MKKLIAAMLAAVMCLALLTACGNNQTANDDSWKTIEERGEFVLGLDASFPPMGFKEDGEIVGFDIDLAKAVAEKLGLEVRLQPIDWNTKELELNGKNIDMIWNGFSVTPERQEQFLLSQPYMTNMQVIMTKIDSPIQTLDDLRDKKVAAQEGSSVLKAFESAYADRKDVFDSIEQVRFPDNMTASLDLENGQVDGLALDSVVADYIMAKNPGKYTILEETLAPEDYAIAFRKGDKTFCDKVDQAINELIEEGTFETISYKWMGKNVAHMQRTSAASNTEK